MFSVKSGLRPFEQGGKRVCDRRAPFRDGQVIVATKVFGHIFGITQGFIRCVFRGSMIQRTFSAPNASAAIVATNALSTLNQTQQHLRKSRFYTVIRSNRHGVIIRLQLIWDLGFHRSGNTTILGRAIWG